MKKPARSGDQTRYLPLPKLANLIAGNADRISLVFLYIEVVPVSLLLLLILLLRLVVKDAV